MSSNTTRPAEKPLAGRVALVTGATQGIGRAIARRLAAEGASIIACGSGRSAEGVGATCDVIRGAGGRAAPLLADLANVGARENLIARAADVFGSIDILINNAASVGGYAPPSRISYDDRHLAFEVNLHAAFDLIQQAVPAMVATGWGRIVNISSETARTPAIPYPGSAKFIHMLTAYGASKIALERATAALAAELHGTGVTANVILPYRIALSENAEMAARMSMDAHPEWIEGVEMMAEAAAILVAGRFSGVIACSREVLRMTQSPLHGVDGVTILGDARTLARPE